MRFRSGARLDPSQVTDVRGRRVGGPVLAGGGGIGVVGLTSISASSTSCNRASARRAGRSRRLLLAHEYGHHVQALLGTLGREQQASCPEGGSVRPSSRLTATPASGRITPWRPD